MTSESHKAIYLDSNGDLSVREMDSTTYTPTDAQSLVQVKYSAINPADTRHFHMGLSSFVAGYEFVGTVAATGPSSPFHKDQSIFGVSLPGDHRPVTLGAHQDLLLASPFMTYALPPGLDPRVAVSMPAAVHAGLDALFNINGFALPAAALSGDDPTGRAILIWGGASMVGMATVQLARIAGFSPILTTASPRNHAALRERGATHCFDYRSPTVVDEVRAAVRASGKKLYVVFDAVATGLGVLEGLSEEQQRAVDAQYDKSSPALARRCCDEDVAEADLRLCASLPVAADRKYKFCSSNRLLDGQKEAVAGTIKGVESMLESEEFRGFGERIVQGMEWLLENHADHWIPPKIRTVKGAEAGIAAIKEVWAGVSGEKVIIEHPF